MAKKISKLFLLSPLLTAPIFLTSCIDLAINKDLVSNKSDNTTVKITDKRSAIAINEPDDENDKVEDIAYKFGPIKSEISRNSIQVSSQKLKNGFYKFLN